MRIWAIVLWIVAALVALFVYFIPTYVAFKNDHPSKWGIFAINTLLGVTLLGWVAALMWSTSPSSEQQR